MAEIEGATRRQSLSSARFKAAKSGGGKRTFNKTSVFVFRAKTRQKMSTHK